MTLYLFVYLYDLLPDVYRPVAVILPLHLQPVPHPYQSQERGVIIPDQLTYLDQSYVGLWTLKYILRL